MPLSPYSTARSRKVITWSLLLAFLTLVLFPFHYHLHHATDAGVSAALGQAHVLDIHVLSDLGAMDKHHADSHAIDPNTGVTPSHGQQLPLVFAFLAVTVLFLAAAQVVAGGLRWPAVARQSLPLVAYASPPLRAPPHC